MSNTASIGGVAFCIGITGIVGLWSAKQVEGDSDVPAEQPTVFDGTNDQLHLFDGSVLREG